MGNRTFTVILATAVVAIATTWSLIPGAAAQEKLPSKSDPSCLKCHEYDKASNLFAGKFVDVSTKAGTLSIRIDKDMEVLFFDDSTTLKNAENFRAIPKEESVRIVYYRKDGKVFAKVVEVKKGLEVPKEKLISTEDVAALVAKAPEKGKYVLLDSRPADMFNQGHIPTSASMPFFAFDKLQESLLPKDKDVLQIYYCAGFS